MTESSNLLKLVKNLEIRTRGIVEGMQSGSYRSKFRGGGIEFSEVREYVPGDDTRRIDWNVSARHDTVYMKEFVEERELNVYAVVDISASNDFGFEKTKKELCQEIVASIMFGGVKNNDRIGMALFTNKLEKFVPAKKGKGHMLKLLHELTEYESKSKQTDISKSLSELYKHLHRHSMVFIISDFISDSFLQPLKYLKKHHDVILVNISDIREVNIPHIGNVFLEDAETGEQMIVNTSDKKFQEYYSKYLNETKQKISHEIKKLKIDMVNVTHDEPFEVTFNRFFSKRITK